MKKAIAMRATQENWDSIKDRVPKERINSINSFKKYEWLFIEEDFSISNIKRTDYWKSEFDSVEEIHETFNAKIFLEACGIETDVYEITKEQIRMIEPYYSAVKFWFPDVFKKPFTGWAKDTSITNEKWLAYFENGFMKYGIGANDDWFVKENGSYNFDDSENHIEATPQEVETALKNEWIKNNKNIFKIDNSNICELGGKYKISNNPSYRYWEANNMFTVDEVCVFLNGKFANVIEIETITIQEAEKLLKEQGINKKIV